MMLFHLFTQTGVKFDNFWHFPTGRNTDSGQVPAPVRHLSPSVVRAGYTWGHGDMAPSHPTSQVSPGSPLSTDEPAPVTCFEDQWPPQYL